jgi:PadR family transcriptional regulator, regulatory protein PadR
VTPQLLALLEALLDAYVRDQELHGYALMKRSGLSGPSTYRNLDRLEDANLVTLHWEELPAGDERPRRCFYSLNPDGAVKARELLAVRNPSALERIGRAPSPDHLRRPGWAVSPRPQVNHRCRAESIPESRHLAGLHDRGRRPLFVRG